MLDPRLGKNFSDVWFWDAPLLVEALKAGPASALCDDPKTPAIEDCAADIRLAHEQAIAALKKARRNWQAICEVSNMEPVRATLEADLAIAPMLRHSIPESLAALSDSARLPRLPVFRVNLYEAARPNPAVKTFAENARLCMAVH